MNETIIKLNNDNSDSILLKNVKLQNDPAIENLININNSTSPQTSIINNNNNNNNISYSKYKNNQELSFNKLANNFNTERSGKILFIKCITFIKF